jgi:uncharacterized membrane protein
MGEPVADGPSTEPASMSTGFRRFFLRGLAALLPTIVTIALLVWAYNFVQHVIERPLTQGLVSVLAIRGEEKDFALTRMRGDLLKYGTPLDEFDHQLGQLTREYKVIADPAAPAKLKRLMLWQVVFRKYHLGLLVFAVVIAAVYFLGFFLASFMGRAMLRALESAIGRIPLVKAIYPHVKQVTDFVLNQRKVTFGGVVAVQYPRKGIWSLGLMTGAGLRSIRDRAGTDVVSIFMPSSPTPVSGYVIMVPAKDVVELAISVDDAFRFIVTGGVVKPPGEILLEHADAAELGEPAGSTPKLPGVIED